VCVLSLSLSLSLSHTHKHTQAMLPLIDTKEGRLLHTSSGVSSMYLKAQSAELKALFSNPDITLEVCQCS